jgi:hypothetical protein
LFSSKVWLLDGGEAGCLTVAEEEEEEEEKGRRRRRRKVYACTCDSSKLLIKLALSLARSLAPPSLPPSLPPSTSHAQHASCYVVR